MANVSWGPLKQLIANGEIRYPMTCHYCIKAMYLTVEDAEKVAKLMNKKGTKNAQVYKCKKHPKHGWHLTSGY
tara:strand:+ start:8540 stop:8758 length:219 start_codon:yes stop_codon:yes gene_type:complete